MIFGTMRPHEVHFIDRECSRRLEFRQCAPLRYWWSGCSMCPDVLKEDTVAIERTFAMLKPGIVQRRLVGEVLSRLEKKGFRIVALKFMMIPEALAKRHYGEHAAKSFFESLITYITSGPVVAMVFQGESVIPVLRKICGATRVEEFQPGTIRGDFAMHTDMNIIHASDSNTSAEREIGLFFKPEEIYDWKDGNDAWI